nr:hypothetical protein CFP56_70693 [Quercus suber]
MTNLESTTILHDSWLLCLVCGFLGLIDFQCSVLGKENVENREEKGTAQHGSAFWRKDNAKAQSMGGLGNRFQGSVLDSRAISMEFGPNLRAPPFVLLKKKSITVPGFFSSRKMNNKAGQASQSREEEPSTQQNQTKKLSESVHEPTDEPIGAERYRQGGDKHSMSNGWSDTNLTNHGSLEFSLPLSPTINGILSYLKGIDTELNVGNDDSLPILAPIKSNSQQ